MSKPKKVKNFIKWNCDFSDENRLFKVIRVKLKKHKETLEVTVKKLKHE